MSPVYPFSQAAHDDAVAALLAELGTVPGQISTALAARTVAAGAGLSGGGTLAADRTLSLSAGSVASLARADTAIQPADIQSRAPGVDLRDWVDFDGTGAHDNSAVLAAAHTQCPVGGAILIPPASVIAKTATWDITKSITVQGAGVSDVWGPRVRSFDYPTDSPYIVGSVFLHAGAGTDAIQINGTSPSVHLRDIGIRFDDAIKWTNTGHGISTTPDAFNGYKDHGLIGSLWQNVKVYGHDGNHYAFKLINPLLNTMVSLRGYGGGLMQLVNDSDTGGYGNGVVIDAFGEVFCGGTAHGIEMLATHGALNLMSFIRPQVITENGPSTPDATSAQYLFKNTGCGNYSVISGDFETQVGSLCDFGAMARKFISPDGHFGASTYSSSGASTITQNVTITKGPGAGASAMSSGSTGDDNGGLFYINIASDAPSPGSKIATVDFFNPGARRSVMVQSYDQWAVPYGFYVANITSTGFEIYSTVKPPAGTYSLSFLAVP